jgi:membrane-associated phospholipid phosphatase
MKAEREPVDVPKEVVGELDHVDRLVYAAVAGSRTPTIDESLRRLSNAANNSRLWMGVAAGLALLGPRGRRAAASGLIAIAATSAVTNLALKTTVVRSRPDRAAAAVARSRHVRMPESTSFPSGHSASAFAFATAAGEALPAVTVPLHAVAGAVAYSRVHTGVHYPGDVIVGSFVGFIIGTAVNAVFRRFPGRR